MNWLQSFFNTPARQALGWTLLGVLGIAMAAGGVWFLTDDGGSSARVASDDNATPRATATATISVIATLTATATPSPSPSPSATATSTATPRPVSNAGVSSGGGGSNTSPEPTATPEPTQPPVVAGGDYCPPSNNGPGTIPSGRVAGAVTVAGADAAPGTVDIYLAFDGVLGPGVKNVAGAFRIDFYANTAGCANRVGAAISAYANGQYFPTGHTVGDGAQLIPVTVALP